MWPNFSLQGLSPLRKLRSSGIFAVVVIAIVSLMILVRLASLPTSGSIQSRSLSRLPSDSIFLSSAQQQATKTFSSSSVFILAIDHQNHLGEAKHLSTDACLTVESAIARRLNVEIVDLSIAAEAVNGLSRERPVIVSIGKSDLYFTNEASDENLSNYIRNLPTDWVIVPGSKICEDAVVCSGYPETNSGEFKYASSSAVLGRAGAVASFLGNWLATCGSALNTCMHRMYISGKFGIRIDHETQFFLETHDFKREELPQDGSWGVTEDGTVRNPKTNVAPMILVFDHHIGHYAGRWRIRNFVFQPQTEIGWTVGNKAERRSFLQEVCPYGVLRWLPLTVPGKAQRNDGRCSSVCIDGYGICGGKDQLPTSDGHQSECSGLYGCCSASGWCGYSKEHCDCPLCIDYKRVNALRAQINAYPTLS